MRYSFNEIRRQSHNKRADPKSLRRMVLMVLLITACVFYFIYKMGQGPRSMTPAIRSYTKYVPEAVHGRIYHKPYFSLSYVGQYELPEWVTYELTVDMLNHKKFERNQEFIPDPEIGARSADDHDYMGSGYRRGHLVPAADMAWNKQAMDATFLLSNVAPMKQNFNDGIWNELEQDVRDWGRLHKDITVVAGPVFRDAISTIGDDRVLVPRYFYKAVFTVDGHEPKVIGFILDQTLAQPGELKAYIVPIDSIEKVTGLDLFSNLYGSWDKEITSEREITWTTTDWPFNPRWYRQRMEHQ